MQVTSKKAKKTKIEKDGAPKTDMFCLCNVTRFAKEWPQVAKVLSVNGDNVKIMWYTGTKTTRWKPYTVSRGRGLRVPTTETVHLSSEIWHYNFALTKSGKLPEKERRLVERFDKR